MHKVEQLKLQSSNIALDFLCCAAAYALGLLTRYHIDVTHDPIFRKFASGDFVSLFVGIYLTLLLTNSLFLHYPANHFYRFSKTTRLYLRSVFVGLVMTLVFAYLIFPLASSRLLIISTFIYVFVFYVIKEWLLRLYIKKSVRDGSFKRNVLIVSNDEKTVSHMDLHISTLPIIGLQVLGFMSQNFQTSTSGATKYLGDLKSSLASVLDGSPVDCVIFSDLAYDEDIYHQAVWECSERGIEVWMRINIPKNLSGSAFEERIGDYHFIVFRAGPQSTVNLFIKAIIDRVLSFVLLIILFPIMILVAILIKCTSQGPVIFKQHRASIHGRKFIFYKFRTMVRNADEMKEALHSHNEMKGPVFKITNDPRITPLGKYLRKLSLDELPQLWNVLIGDMSLVGPRPLPYKEFEKTTGWQRRRFSMKPGITCFWQVEGRNKILDFDDWARLDLKYIDEWNLGLDFVLIFRTIFVVFKGTGC